MTHVVDEQDGQVVVRLRGPAVGGPDGARFHDTLRTLKAEGHTHVVADLSGLTRMDPVGLGVLLGGLAFMRNAGGEMYLADLPDHVHSLLVITDLRGPLACFDSVADALRARSEAIS